MQQYQFNELDDRMSKLEKGQNITKLMEETAVELEGEILMDSKLVGNFITQKVTAAMAEKKNSMKRQIKTGERWKRCSVGIVGQKRYEGWWTCLQEKEKSATQTTTKSKTPKKSASQ